MARERPSNAASSHSTVCIVDIERFPAKRLKRPCFVVSSHFIVETERIWSHSTDPLRGPVSI